MKKIVYFIYFILAINFAFGENKIPHELIIDNPKAKITTIETKKQYKEKAELKLSITKIKSKKIEYSLDKENKLITFNFEKNNIKINDNEKTYVGGSLKELPLNNNFNKIHNQCLMVRSNLINNNEFIYNTIPQNDENGRKVLKVAYNNIPSDIYLAVLDENNNVKEIYKGQPREEIDTVNNPVHSTLNIWLFDKEFQDDLNLVFNYDKNSSGKILVRPQDTVTSPEDARDGVFKYESGSVFDFSEAPLKHVFLPSTYVQGQSNRNINSIEQLQDTFSKNHREGIKVTTKYFTLKSYIYNDFSGIEINVKKNSEVSQSELESFDLIVYNKNNQRLETITINLYVNSGTLMSHFENKSASTSTDIPDFWGNDGNSPIDRDVTITNKQSPEGSYSIENFATDDVDFNKLSTYSVLTGINGQKEISSSNFEISENELNRIKPTNGVIHNSLLPPITVNLLKEWYPHGDNIDATIWWYPLEITYCKGKKKFLPGFSYRVIKNINFREYDSSTDIYNLPVLYDYLDGGTNKNEDIDYAFNNFLVYESENYKKISLIYKDRDLLGSNTLTPVRIAQDGCIFDLVSDPIEPNTHKLKIIQYTLSSTSRTIKFDLDYTRNDGFRNLCHETIQIKPFVASWLYDNINSSFKLDETGNSTTREIDEYIQKDSLNKDIELPLGNVYFKTMNYSILNQSSASMPQMVLSKNFYIKDNDGNKIYVNLKFKNNQDRIYQSSGKGSLIVLTIPHDKISQLIKNNRETTYQLYSDEDNKLLKIGFDNSTAGAFWSDLKVNVILHFLPFEPEKIQLNYSKDYPLIKDNLCINNKSYVKQKNYNSDVSIDGTLRPFNNGIKDKTEAIINNQSSLINPNELDCGDGNIFNVTHDSTGNTFFNIKNWNFKNSQETILMKYYTYEGVNLYNYVQYTVNLPELDPYIYYDNENSSIKLKSSEISIIRTNDKRIYLLGEIQLKNLDTEITKNNDDLDGIKFKTKEVQLKNSSTNEIFDKKAKIYIEKEHIYSNSSKGEKLKLYLELPEKLPRNNNFEIDSDFLTDKNYDLSSVDENNYILAIGRKGFYKEIIPKVIIKSQNELHGQSTIKFKNSYVTGKYIFFKGLPITSNEELSFAQNDSISKYKNRAEIINSSGNGLLKLNSNNYLIIRQSTGPLYEGLISNKTLDSQNFTVNHNLKMSIEVQNGDIGLALKSWKNNSSVDNKITIEIRENNAKGRLLCEHELTILPPDTFFRIIDKQIMDFGQIIQGQKNISGEGYIEFETSEDTNINVSLDKNLLPLHMKNDVGDINPKNKIIVKNLHSILTSNDKKKYKVEVLGTLDTSPDTTPGIYKNRLMINIEVKE
ncbi:MAG: hypothetical protein ACRC1R_02595 [Cetobacterium sp.]|uniref:hypothetical protein n=1 Tax=Cetobacterium sp. TaxID=2071632 RepID=UPI003F32028C